MIVKIVYVWESKVMGDIGGRGEPARRGWVLGSKRVTIAAVIGLPLLFYPAQIAGGISQISSYAVGSKDCNTEVENFERSKEETASDDPNSVPRVLEIWSTKSGRHQGRVDLHVKVIPVEITPEESYSLIVNGKYGIPQYGNLEGFGDDYRPLPPEQDVCATWWAIGPSDTSNRSHEFIFSGLLANRRYCFVTSQTEDWTQLGTRKSKQSAPTCYVPKWRASWGWMMFE